MGVSVAVVADIVARIVNFFDLIGVFVHPVAAKEKRGLYIVFI